MADRMNKHVRIVNRPQPTSLHHPCADCDWPNCMNEAGTICLFNLPDEFYEDTYRAISRPLGT